MPATEIDPQRSPAGENRLLASIPRFRWAFFALVGVLVILSFNGQWRIGRDSAAYRGLAHRLATTGQYVFRDKPPGMSSSDHQDTRYPGFAVLLAGVERLAGRGAPPAIALVMLTGVAALVLTYRLLKGVVPSWVAVAVTFNLGINARFLEHNNEILSDVPFLMGVMLALLAFERLSKAVAARPRAGWAALLVVALVFSAALRPTFWILAGALAVTCVFGAFAPAVGPRSAATESGRSSRRVASLLTLGVLALAAAAFVMVLDIRGKGTDKYVRNFLVRFGDRDNQAMTPMRVNVHEGLEEVLPEAVFGTQFGSGVVPFLTYTGTGPDGRPATLPLKWGLGTAFSLALIGCAVALVWRNALWGVFLFASVASLVAAGSVPRYFVMVMPLLLVAWISAVGWAAGRVRHVAARWAVVFVGLGVIVGPNLIRAADLIREQRGFARPTGKQQGLKHVGFELAYHSGKWSGVREVADMIRDNTKPGERVIGPEATVLTYLSGRDVFPVGMLLNHEVEKWPHKLRVSAPLYAYALFPANVRKLDGTTNRLFDDKDALTWKVINAGILKPDQEIGHTAARGYTLSTYAIARPPPAAEKLPATRRVTPRKPRATTRGAAPAAAPPTTRRAPKAARAATQAAARAATRAVKTTTTTSATTATAPATAPPRRVRKSPRPAATLPLTRPASRPATPPPPPPGARPGG